MKQARLLELDYLRAARERLPWETSLAAHRDDTSIDAHVDAIGKLIAQPLERSVQRAALEREYKQLVILLPTGHAIVHEQRDRIADHFLVRAQRAREAGSFKEAFTFIESGRFFHPGFPPFDAESRMLAQAQAQLRARRDAERMAALKASLKAEFRSKAETNQVQEAKSLLLELRAQGLGDDDAFMREEAPRLLADAYARLAATRATRRDFDGAISLAEAGLRQWPEHDELRARLAGYEIARESQRFETTLRRRLADPTTLDIAATAADLARLEARFPTRYAQTAAELASIRRLTVLDYARSAQPIGDSMAAHLSAYVALFPAHRGDLADQLVAIASERLRAQTPTTVEDIEALRPVTRNIAALPASEQIRLQAVVAESVIAGVRLRASQDPEGARQLLAAGRALLPTDERLLSASRELPMPELERARANLREGSLNAAARDLDAATREDPSHPGIQALRSEIEAAMREARQAYRRYVDDIAKAEAREQRKFDQLHANIVALWNDNAEFQRLSIRAPRKGECHDALAGHGAQAAGSCYDLVAGRKGPEMVVVPAGNGLARAFAIGKYEVSVSDFNHFCEQSGQCAARTDSERRLPVTEISIAEAEAYARWLSAEASRQNGHPIAYRLPTAAEWQHAATADGQQPERKFNCRVFAAGEVIAGHDLVDARSGKQNGWGLANYAGNAREWVRNDQGLAVRGGAYDDPLTECGPEHDEAHTGQADELTGFRLVRELG
jgi:hypothetical protein